MAETVAGCPAEAEEWELYLENLNRVELECFGGILDQRPARLRGRTVGMALAERLLLVRTRDGKPAPLRANAVQREFEKRRGQRNIVLKARQMGLTTWTAARFFLKTITHPGTLTLQVAHNQEAAEEIFRIVHRFLDWLPEALRVGPLVTSRANVRQIVFPEIDAQYRVVTAGDRNAGRGLTVQNLHCSELARWPGDAAETLSGLRAAMAPGAELILESTPEGVGGCFHEEWRKADETAMVRHFFPWWMERRYRARAVDEFSLSDEERDLMARKRLTLEQIGFRRRMRADFRGLARQEYAEDAESCFLASGDSVFELAAIEARLAPGSIVALDVDNTGQTGFVGSPVAGAYIRQALADVDYIRRITFNVALVSQVNSTGLTLADPLPGGAPSTGAKLQAVTGFVDREGGSFYQEWSALFVAQGSQGERIFYHYPRLQTMIGAEEATIPLNDKNPGGQSRVLLKGQFLALPVTDPLDGERVICYRSFLPAAKALV